MVTAPSTDRARATAATIDLFAAWGVAILPGPYGEKGSRVHGWPSLPPAEAAAIARRELVAKGSINLAARTGPALGVIDLDGKDGIDPSTALRRLLSILPVNPPVAKTSRGYHVWFRPTQPVGDGLLPTFGGELFTGGHLVNVPPSRHPDGADYEWLIPPGGELPEVDLEALGLLPMGITQPVEAGLPRNGRREPASAEIQAEFQSLMTLAGAHPRRGGEELIRCPWHEDDRASLGVNWKATVFICHATSCAVQGGIGTLRRLVSESKTPRLNGSTTSKARNNGSPPANGAPTAVKLGGSQSGLSVVAAQRRLSEALVNAGENAASQEVLRCSTQFKVGVCTECGRRPAYPVTCKHPLCPKCMPGRLAADWKRHQGSMPGSMTLLQLTPTDVGTSELKVVRSRFAEWRKRVGLSAGIYGVRLTAADGELSPDVLLAVPDEEANKAQASRAFQVEVIARGQTPADTLRWLQGAYLEEATSWTIPEEMLTLLAEIKGRRRFQGFGKAYGKQEKPPESAERPLGRVSGGACRGGAKEARSCPACGGQVEMLPGTVPSEQVRKVGANWWWSGPPRRRVRV